VGRFVLERICADAGKDVSISGRAVGDDQKGCHSFCSCRSCGCAYAYVDVAKRKTSPSPEPNSRRLIGGNLKDDVPMVILHGSTE
jgi:hypothetical protein